MSGGVLYLQSVSALQAEVQSNLKSEAVTLATLVNADTHPQFTTRLQEKEAAYQNAIAPLYRVLRARKDIKFIYTCVLRSDKVYFVLDPTPEGDADHDGVQDKSYIGQLYLDASPQMLETLHTGTPQVDATPYKDAWGTFLSAYAPLRNKKGQTTGAVGVDIAASDYMGRVAVVKAAALVGLGVALVVSFAVGLLVKRLFMGVRAARNALEARVSERTGELAQANAVLQQEVKERERALLALKASEENLAYQAYHDALTGLPNRALFVDRLERALANSIWRDRFVAVLFLDLNGFKVINDSLGHEAGDRLLEMVAQQLQTCLRPGDTVARLGGDEFTVLLDKLHDLSEARQIAGRIVEQLSLPLYLEGREVFTSASIGIASSQNSDNRSGMASHGQRQQECNRLLRDADTAMYQAKRTGSRRFVVFDPVMNTDAMERLELEADLRRALQKNEFQVFFQPIIHLYTGHLSGVEALVR